MIHLEKAKKVLKGALFMSSYFGSGLALRSSGSKSLVSFHIRVWRLPPLAVLSRVLMQSPLLAAEDILLKPLFLMWSCSTTQGSGTWATASVLAEIQPREPGSQHTDQVGGRWEMSPSSPAARFSTKSPVTAWPHRSGGKQTPSRQALSSSD